MLYTYSQFNDAQIEKCACVYLYLRSINYICSRFQLHSDGFTDRLLCICDYMFNSKTQVNTWQYVRLD